MLSAFRRKVAFAEAKGTALFVADANARWPVADHSVRAIFGSRTLHLLERDHVVNETMRVASRAGAALLIGRIRREPDSVTAKMRQKMRQLLGLGSAHKSEEGSALLIQAFVDRGASAILPSVAAQWSVTKSARQSLESWQGKDGLAGTVPAEDIKAEVLSKLERWATDAFGSLDEKFESREEYVLEGVRLPAR